MYRLHAAQLSRLLNNQCSKREACSAMVLPQARPEHGMSKRSYVDAVLAGLDAARKAGGDGATLVRLLLSIDRRECAASAMETVELAAELSDRGVVGIDLSGGPRCLSCI